MKTWLASSLLVFSSLAFSMSCDNEASPQAVRQLVHAVFIGLRDSILTRADVEYMISEEKKIANPWEAKERDIDSIALRRKIIGYLAKFPVDQVEVTKRKLAELLKQNEKVQAAVAEAVEQTAPIFNPKHIATFDDADVGKLAPLWHRDTQGKLKLVNYNPKTHHLQIFDPELRGIDTDFTFANPLNLKPSSEDILSTANGELWIAQLFEHSRWLGIFDGVKKAARYYELKAAYNEIRLVRGADDTLYLVARTSQSIATYRLGEQLELVRRHDFKLMVGNLSVMTSAQGRILILASDQHAGGVYVIDPFVEQPIRVLSCGGEVALLQGAFTPAGEYVVAAVVRNHVGMAYEVNFLTSNSETVLTTGQIWMASFGTLQLTENGRILFPVSVVKSIFLFDPLTPTFESLNWWKRWRKVPPRLQPAQTLDGEYLGTNLLTWSVTQGGRRLLTTYQHGSQGQTEILVYEPEVQNTPIASFAIGNGDHQLKTARAEIPIRSEQVLGIVTRFTPQPFEVYEATGNPRIVLTGPVLTVTPPAYGVNSQVWIAGTTSPGPLLKSELHLYSLFNKEAWR